MNDTPPPRRRRNRVRPLAALLLFSLLCGAGLAAWVWSRYAGSLPQTSGTLSGHDVSAPVSIERDARGVPTLRAENRRDLAFACGFVHGQDRFFQMDLLRRHPAGELAALAGPLAVEEDSRMRAHRFRHRARRAVQRMPAEDREILDAYAAGVEAGRGSLRQKPWEYQILRAEPEPWRPEDTALVVYAMYGMLQNANVNRERTQGLLEELLPEPLVRFLSPRGSPWDAPLMGAAYPSAEVPPAEAIDLRLNPNNWRAVPRMAPPVRALPGSNNWAVDARHTTHGGAIVACDMHLHLMAPGIWYRAAFVWQGHRVVGATLPGTPAIVAGSNGHVAWGFTNVEADTSDQVYLVADPKRPDYYQTAEGPMPLEKHDETIHVNGGPPRTVIVEETVFGPVIGRDHKGRRVALRWVAHEPDAMNLGLMRLETARSVQEALTIGPRCGTPAQNLTVADRRGHVGWTVLGRLPNRVGYDGRTPSPSDDGGRRWEGLLPSRLYPRIIDPPSGRIWTANNRTVDEPHLSRLGVGTYDHGARAQQIRDGLLSLPKAREADMLAIQLDDRAVFLTRWQRLLVEVLSSDKAKGDSRRESMLREVRFWGARASTESVGFRLVRHFRHEVLHAVLSSLAAPCVRAYPTFNVLGLDGNVDQSVYVLATTKPDHLLPPDQPDWEALLLACVDRVADFVKGRGTFEDALRGHTWGAANVAMIRHPLSPPLGPVARWMDLDMPAEPLPGDSRGMPRIQTPTEGASQRMAVSPGREEEGYFMMPAGQSGHPLSPHYRDGHDDWAKGRPSPFLPGPAVNVLELRPAGG